MHILNFLFVAFNNYTLICATFTEIERTLCNSFLKTRRDVT